MCWLTNSGGVQATRFEVRKLHTQLKHEVDNGDLKMSHRELRLLMRALDDGRGCVDYNKLRVFTTPSKVRAIGAAGAPVPRELQPRSAAAPPDPALEPAAFRPHCAVPAFLPQVRPAHDYHHASRASYSWMK